MAVPARAPPPACRHPHGRVRRRHPGDPTQASSQQIVALPPPVAHHSPPPPLTPAVPPQSRRPPPVAQPANTAAPPKSHPSLQRCPLPPPLQIVDLRIADVVPAIAGLIPPPLVAPVKSRLYRVGLLQPYPGRPNNRPIPRRPATDRRPTYGSTIHPITTRPATLSAAHLHACASRRMIFILSRLSLLSGALRPPIALFRFCRSTAAPAAARQQHPSAPSSPAGVSFGLCQPRELYPQPDIGCRLPLPIRLSRANFGRVILVSEPVVRQPPGGPDGCLFHPLPALALPRPSPLLPHSDSHYLSHVYAAAARLLPPARSPPNPPPRAA